MKRIGIYGGTFDPLHFGHLNLAIGLKEAHNLDEVWFIPAHQNPHKNHEQSVSIEHRVAMLNAIIPQIPNFRVVDIEAKRQPPSYTIDTIQTIMDSEQKDPKGYQFYLMVGEDSVANFLQWKEPDLLVSLVPLLIAVRGDSTTDFNKFEAHPKILEAIELGITKIGLFDISSTEIRARLKSGLYCGYLIPSKILDYINKNHLYSFFNYEKS